MPTSPAPVVTVAVVEITEPTSGLSYLPYAAGLLQAYALAHARDPQRYSFLLPQFLREPMAAAVANLATSQVVGFSVYVWNINYNLALAQALKAQQPDTLIVFGGPQVPDQAADFLARHAFIDVLCHGEGEATFLRLLEAYPGNQWHEIPGISYRDASGRCQTNPRAARIKDLDQIPSPYASGLFEPLMAQYPDIGWTAVWETNRGCPFSCAFCDWGSAVASKVYRFGEERLQAEIRWFGEQQIQSLYCADANYGMLPRDLDLARYMVSIKQQKGFPARIITQMTKNQPDRAFAAHQILHEAGLLVSATLSLQTVTPQALQAARRENISLETYHQLLKRFVQHGIPTYTDFLLGLPGDTFDSFLDAIAAVITQGQHQELRIWKTYLLPNAEMSQPAYRQQHGIKTVMVPCHPPSARTAGVWIEEECEMIVETHTLSREEWIRTQAMAWLVQMLYYNRILQLPLLLVHELTGLSHRDMILALFEAPLPESDSILGFVRQFLRNKAWEVSQGQSDYCETQSPDTGQTIWVWPSVFCYFQLLLSRQLGSFYRECGQVLEDLLRQQELELPPQFLAEALRYVQTLFEGGLSGTGRPSRVYNLQECYVQILQGRPVQLKRFGVPLLQKKTGP